MRANSIKELFKKSIEIKKSVLQSDADELIFQMAQTISNSISSGGKLLICGNGGSAADAQHLAAELVVRLRPHVNRKALPAISLALDSSFLTACGNDFSFDDIFLRSLEALASSDDVLLGISTSGNSENIRRALARAKELKLKTCAFLGGTGGNTKGLADFEYIVPSAETGRIQEVHIMLGHALMETIENNLLSRGVLQ